MKLALVVMVAGCGAAVPAVPGKGGPAWRELTTDHFTLWTDTSESRARELIREMEDLRQLVIGVGFRGAEGKGRSFVIALRDDDEVAAFMPGDFTAMASPSNSTIRQPMILIAADSQKSDVGHDVTAHELTHTISQVVIRNQPRWFAEGIAEYFQTIEIDRDKGTADVGRPPSHRGEPVIITRMMPLAQMLACEDLTCADKHFYAAAWALFLYLTNVRPDDLTRYEQRLIESPTTAWQDVFGAVSITQLDQDVRHWIVEGSHKILHFNVKLHDWPVKVRTLNDADVYAARALLRLQFQGRKDLAKELVAAALAIEPTNVLALAVSYAAEGTMPIEKARQLAKAHPDDWRSWWLLAVAVGNGEEAAKARATACGMIADDTAITPPWRPCR